MGETNRPQTPPVPLERLVAPLAPAQCPGMEEWQEALVALQRLLARPRRPEAYLLPSRVQQPSRGAREVSVCAGEPGCHAALAAA